MKRVLRLRKDKEFSEVIKYRHSCANYAFVIYSKPNRLNHIRVGVSVSKKLGKANVRNHVKRQIKEMVMATFEEAENKDYVIIARKGYLNNDFAENSRLFVALYEKVERK